MTGRQRPRWAEIKPLIKPRKVERNPIRRRLVNAHTIDDLRRIARRQVPRAVFDYVDGAAGRELGLTRARESFSNLEFRPRVLRNVTNVDLSTELLGRSASWPLAFAPTGFTRMMHSDGERAVAPVAQEFGIPYALATMCTVTPEEVASTAPEGRYWLQLSMLKDRDKAVELMARAESAGFDALIVTVDTPVSGRRLRDLRNGLTIPPALSPRTLIDFAAHPRWAVNLLTTAPLTFAAFDGFPGSLADTAEVLFDASATFDDLRVMRASWQGPLAVKGIQTVEDALLAADCGADAVILSTHGGRQLDRTPPPLLLLMEVVAAVGDSCEVLLDTGILHGADVIAACALGATACLVGRAYLYGLMAGGELGARRAAEILTEEMVTTMQLLGVSSLDELDSTFVRLHRP